MRILVADHLDAAVLAGFEKSGVEVVDRSGISPEDLQAEIGAFEGLVVRSRTKVTAELLAHAPRLRVIGRAGTGVDNIALNEATRRGVLVMNAPGANSNSAAEHSIALMLSLFRRIPQAHA
ncbi:MAG: phosphoglycerate dehydrogenase, partial [Planctomycetes bacterium]|nr:phosphoglycerate dehydrogenase [Planctomycetota bacterium]